MSDKPDLSVMFSDAFADDAEVPININLPAIGTSHVIGYLTDDEIAAFKDIMASMDTIETLLDELDDTEAAMYNRLVSSPPPAEIGTALIHLMGRNPQEYARVISCKDRVIAAKEAAAKHTMLYSVFWYQLRKRLQNVKNSSLTIREGYTICDVGPWIKLSKDF